MKHWNNITIDEYQYLYGIINNDSLSDKEKELRCISKLFDLPKHYLHSLSIDKYSELANSIQFLNDDAIPFVDKIELSINGKEYKIVNNAKDMTFGQYVDVTTFMEYDGGIIGNMNLILASLCDSDIEHNKLSDIFLNQNFYRSFGFILVFIKSYDSLNKSYKSLFNIREDDDDDDIIIEKDNSFHSRWGWVYNAEMLRDFFSIPLKSVWDLNVIEALNGLAYLKDKSINEKAEIDRMNKKNGK
jgi:hypothetical protein